MTLFFVGKSAFQEEAVRSQELPSSRLLLPPSQPCQNSGKTVPAPTITSTFPDKNYSLTLSTTFFLPAQRAISTYLGKTIRSPDSPLKASRTCPYFKNQDFVRLGSYPWGANLIPIKKRSRHLYTWLETTAGHQNFKY